MIFSVGPRFLAATGAIEPGLSEAVDRHLVLEHFGIIVEIEAYFHNTVLHDEYIERIFADRNIAQGIELRQGNSLQRRTVDV